MHPNAERLNQLAPLAQSGDPDALDELITLGYRMVLGIVRGRRYFAPGLMQADWVQEGMRGFLEALNAWREDGHRDFTGFAKLCIDRQLIQTLVMAKRQKHQPLNTAHSLDAPVDAGDPLHSEDFYSIREAAQPDGASIDPAEIVTTTQDAARLAELLMAGLTDIEHTCTVLVLLRGRTYHEVAAVTGRGYKSVDNAMQRARKRMLRNAEALIGGEAIDEELQATLAGIVRRAATGGPTKTAPGSGWTRSARSESLPDAQPKPPAALLGLLGVFAWPTRRRLLRCECGPPLSGQCVGPTDTGRRRTQPLRPTLQDAFQVCRCVRIALHCLRVVSRCHQVHEHHLC